MDLKKIIHQINNLPTLPTVIWKLNDILKNPRTTMADIANVISKDQISTVRVLKLVNSGFYSYPRKISSLTQAITLIGINPLKNLLLASAVFELLSEKKSTDLFDREQFWRHSIACAVSARVIGEHLRIANLEELFVAGLLHDIGKVILDYVAHDSFMVAVKLAHSQNILIKEAEKQILEIDHARVGGLLAKHWNLPPKLCNCITYHHKPQLGKDFFLETSIIHLADIIIRVKNLGNGGDNKIPELDREAWECLGLPINLLEPIMEKVDHNYEESTAILMNPVVTKKNYSGKSTYSYPC